MPFSSTKIENKMQNVSKPPHGGLGADKDYYPFGMVQPGRNYIGYKDSSYRFGFNGKLHDDDIYGNKNSYDYGMRFYNPRLGRPLSRDPLFKKYPELSTYQFFTNNPIKNIDLDGMEGIDAKNQAGEEIVKKLIAIPGESNDKSQNIPTETVSKQASKDVYGNVLNKNGHFTINGTIPGHPLGFSDWKTQSKTNLQNDKITVNWSKKQWQQAYSTYQALSSDKTIEVQVISASSGLAFTYNFGNNKYSLGSQVVLGDVKTHNTSLENWFSSVNGEVSQGNINRLFNNQSYVFKPNEASTNVGDFQTSGEILINGTGKSVLDNATSLSNALQAQYPSK